MNKNYTRFFLTMAVVMTFLFSVSNASAIQPNKFSSAFSFFGALGEPTIATEKYSYNQGETVVIIGSGYRKFEQVSLSIESFSNLSKQNIALGQYVVFADYKGQFRTSVNIDSLVSESETYTVKAFGSFGKTSAETMFVAAPQAIGFDFEQCANGPTEAAAIPCNIEGANDGYTRGNLVPSKAHYVEGESVPIRLAVSGLTPGQQYTVTLGYDYTKGGKYAVDFLTTFTRTENTNNNPCVNVLTCTLDANGNAVPTDTIGIPLDPEVAAGFDMTPATADDITQVPGVFSIFGGTFVSVTGYTRTGVQSGDSSKNFTITFIANGSDIVIAYGAHIAERIDWGFGNSAISISGSPYHNFVSDFPGSNQGRRDLQFGADAVIYKALITIIKDAVPNAPTDFSFTATGPAGITPTSFILDDDAPVMGIPVPGADNTYQNSQFIDNVINFGAGNEVIVTEAPTNGWTLSPNSSCIEQSGANGFPSISDSTFEQGNGRFVIRPQEGEIITCTFINEIVLAASASIDGAVSDTFGRGLSNVLVRVTDLETGESTYVITNNFGRYHIGDLQVGGNYLVKVAAKRYTFTPDTRIITLNEDAIGLNFVANQ